MEDQVIQHKIIICSQSSSIVQLQLSYLVRRLHLLVQIFQAHINKGYESIPYFIDVV